MRIKFFVLEESIADPENDLILQPLTQFYYFPFSVVFLMIFLKP